MGNFNLIIPFREKNNYNEKISIEGKKHKLSYKEHKLQTIMINEIENNKIEQEKLSTQQNCKKYFAFV